LSAVAHQLDAEPQLDPAEAEMPETNFQAIERARELCGHAAARELRNIEFAYFSPLLQTRAIRILSSQIRAAELVREMAERGELSDLGVTETCLVELRLSDDETVDPPVNWKEAAQAAWHSAGWARAAVEYRAECGKQRGVRQ
jgi:hypothetical protein